jgi:hypothetical protein
MLVRATRTDHALLRRLSSTLVKPINREERPLPDGGLKEFELGALRSVVRGWGIDWDSFIQE